MSDSLITEPAFVELLHSHGLDSLDAVFKYTRGEPLNKPGLDTWRRRLRLTLTDGPRTRVFYLKRFLRPPRRARRAVRRSRSGARSLAGNEWIWIHRLTAHGIPCVPGIAYGEQVKGRREVRSAILTAQAAGKSLERWCGAWTPSDRAIVQQLIPATAGLVRKLHAQGYVHRDLYLSHVFFDPARPMEDSLCLIDLQRVIRPQWRLRRWVVKDLAALNYSAPTPPVSRCDRVRWLRYYLGLRKLDAAAKRLAYRVIGKTQGIGARDRRRKHGPTGTPVPHP